MCMTEPEKIRLIYIKYTYSYYGAYLHFYECYQKSFVEFLRSFCIYGEICIRIQYNQNELLNLKEQTLDQILSVDKTCFLRPGHILLMRSSSSISWVSIHFDGSSSSIGWISVHCNVSPCSSISWIITLDVFC